MKYMGSTLGRGNSRYKFLRWECAQHVIGPVRRPLWLERSEWVWGREEGHSGRQKQEPGHRGLTEDPCILFCE